MRKNLSVAMVAGLLLAVAPLLATADEALTLKGEVIEVSCYTKLGIAKATGPAHVACAKECASKGQVLGILTDGDGVFKIVGDFGSNNNAKLLAFVGKQVEATGTLDHYADYSKAINVTKITETK